MAWTTPKTWSVGETLTAANFNTHIRDNENALVHIHVQKSADTARTSTTTLADDPHLLFAVAANEIWYATFVLYVIDGSDGTASFNMHFTGPASSTWTFTGQGLDQGAVMKDHEYKTGADLNADWIGRSAGKSYEISGFFLNSSTAGNFTLQWAQNVSNASATTLKANSFILAKKLA